MHQSPKLTSFIALRANGWSLSNIARQIDVPKSTLWEWDNKHQNEIHLLKHLQLERLQEKFLPTYEEELSSMRSYLDRLEAALAKRTFDFTDSGALLQMALQIRGRMSRLREQVPLRSIPLNQPLAPIPFTGCVSRAADHAESSPPCDSGAGSRPAADDHDGAEVIRNGRPSVASCSDQSSSVSFMPSPVQAPPPELPVPRANQNRTKPDELPPTGKNAPLSFNDLQRFLKIGRPVLQPGQRDKLRE